MGGHGGRLALGQILERLQLRSEPELVANMPENADTLIPDPQLDRLAGSSNLHVNLGRPRVFDGVVDEFGQGVVENRFWILGQVF